MTSTRPARRAIRVPRRDPRSGPTPLALAARSAPTVAGLHIDTDGHLDEIRVPTRATSWALAAHLEVGDGPVAVEAHRLDTDLVMWVAEDLGTGRRNPAAGVAAASFGVLGAVRGAVVFTGWSEGPTGVAGGVIGDVSVAAVILLAAIAQSCDLSDRTAARAAEFARLGITVAELPTPRTPVDSGDRESYDALAHTITIDGEFPKCAECDGPGSHEEHQPEVLAEQAGHRVVGVR